MIPKVGDLVDNAPDGGAGIWEVTEIKHRRYTVKLKIPADKSHGEGYKAVGWIETWPEEYIKRHKIVNYVLMQCQECDNTFTEIDYLCSECR